jgi:MFS family permease
MKKTLWIIALIAVVNALGYGIIIPILYSYSRKFGLTDFQNGLLFSIFSVFQFIATPLIGRLSDAYGRRPLLLISLLGTSASFFTMAFAPNAAWLFVARALDGITAGNIPVALAVISDTTEAKNRAKGFGIIGASFGFGFTFGPAISAFTLHLGESAPFIIAGGIALIAFLLTAIFLPETNTHKGVQVSRRVFDFRHLFHALIDPAIGKTLIVSFLVMLAFSIFIYAFQPMSVEVLKLSPQQISVIFTVMGVIGLISQGVVIPRVIRLFGERVTLVGSIIVSVVTYGGLYFVRAYPLFLTVVLIQSFANGFANPIIQALLSKEADAKSQGSIMGVNASYQSIGQIVGPVLGGMLSTFFIPLPFLAAAIVMATAMVLAFGMLKQHIRTQSLV